MVWAIFLIVIQTSQPGRKKWIDVLPSLRLTGDPGGKIPLEFRVKHSIEKTMCANAPESTAHDEYLANKGLQIHFIQKLLA